MSDLNAPDSAAEPAQEPEIECTFAHCSKKFVTFREMHRHKASAHEHYYCKKCDIDFSSDLKHIMHRVLTTDKHITCPECGFDFKIKAGLVAHVERMHPHKQSITCFACGKRLPQASMVVKHVEDGQCKISPAEWRTERAGRAVAREGFLQRYEKDSGSHVSSNHSGHEGGSRVGPQAAAAHPDELLSMDTIADRFAGTGISSQPATVNSNATWQTAATFKLSDYWCPKRNVFICPGSDCGQAFAKAERFHDHLSSHGGTQATCPSCLRHFASNYALLCHMESPGRKCNIRHSVNYNQVLRELSAGLVGTGGHFEDGTVKYIMPEDEGWQAEQAAGGSQRGHQTKW